MTGGGPDLLLENVRRIARLRDISFEEAKRLTIAQFQENAEAEPRGPWLAHIERLEGFR